jgi:hypothetical protein
MKVAVTFSLQHGLPQEIDSTDVSPATAFLIIRIRIFPFDFDLGGGSRSSANTRDVYVSLTRLNIEDRKN